MYGNFSEQSLQQVESMFDFKRCVRSDGSAYGTDGTCRKGKRRDKDPEPAKGRTTPQSPSRKQPKSKPKAQKTTTKSSGMRITAKIKAMSVKDLKKVLEDPRATEKQRALIQSIIESKQKSPRPRKQPKVAKPASPEVPKVAQKPTPPQRGPEPKPSSESKSKVTDEQLKRSFDKALANYERTKGSWKDRKAEARALEAISTIRMAYHAVNRDEFLRASAELARNRRLSERLTEQGRIKESSKVDQENEKVRKRVNAAYFGEPSKPRPLQSDGGGKVHSSVPSAVPRGGADRKLKDFLEGSEVVMAFHGDGFSKFVQQGVAKNGFEAGTGGLKKGKAGGGSYYLDERRKGEKYVLGIPKEAAPQERPVYAALEHPDRSRSLQGGNGLMAQYGGIQVVLNSSVKDRSTFTIGDSLDHSNSHGIMASPVRDPANPVSYGKKAKVEYGDNPDSKSITIQASDERYPATPPYVEAQIHGGLRASDIKEVRYYRGHEIDPATRSLLEKQGVRIVELPPRQEDLRIEDDHPGFRDISARNTQS